MTESSVVACSATAAVGFLKLLAGFSVKLSDRSAISRESARTEKLVLKINDNMLTTTDCEYFVLLITLVYTIVKADNACHNIHQYSY